MNSKKNLVLITGLIRKPELFNNLLSNNFFEDCDIYICTNKDQETSLNKLNLKENIFFIEDDSFQKILEGHLLSLGVSTTRWDKVPGSLLLQWQKLNYLVYKIGEEKILKYENVFKIRTDLKIKSENLKSLKFEESEIKMNSDFCFGSKSKNFLIISNFFYSAISEYWNNINYQPFQIKNIDKFDYDSAKFQWLKYPESVVKKDLKLYLKHRLELLFAKRKLKLITEKDIKKFIIKYKEEISDVESPYENVVYFRKHQFKIFFPSEPSFLHYLLINNFKIKKLFNEVEIVK